MRSPYALLLLLSLILSRSLILLLLHSPRRLSRCRIAPAQFGVALLSRVALNLIARLLSRTGLSPTPALLLRRTGLSRELLLAHRAPLGSFLFWGGSGDATQSPVLN